AVYTLSLRDALPIYVLQEELASIGDPGAGRRGAGRPSRRKYRTSRRTEMNLDSRSRGYIPTQRGLAGGGSRRHQDRIRTSRECSAGLRTEHGKRDDVTDESVLRNI